jgi:hypothetical protein
MSLDYRTIKAFPLDLKPHLRLMAYGMKPRVSAHGLDQRRKEQLP